MDAAASHMLPCVDLIHAYVMCDGFAADANLTLLPNTRELLHNSRVERSAEGRPLQLTHLGAKLWRDNFTNKPNNLPNGLLI